MKAVYQHQGWAFRYTHDLDELITGLREKGMHVPPEVADADTLSGFAWEARYPGLGEPVTYEEYAEALRNAEIVVAWAAETIKG